jgi:hypothetical protein
MTKAGRDIAFRGDRTRWNSLISTHEDTYLDACGFEGFPVAEAERLADQMQADLRRHH